MTTTNSISSTKRMVWVALFTAITCILAPLSIPIPISPVPITLTNLVLFISLYIPEARRFLREDRGYSL